jgi:hypothetical protein
MLLRKERLGNLQKERDTDLGLIVIGLPRVEQKLSIAKGDYLGVN